MQGNTSRLTATEAVATLNDRLNKASEGLQQQCERIEHVLGRVHGNPTPKAAIGGGDVSRITPSLPLATIVEHMEGTLNRLAEIANSAERIA